ncbi:MAG: class I SAM-dependent methyltransferase [Zavarzinella sp.]
MTLPVDHELKSHQADWETLATIDPFWAVLSLPEMRGNRWEPERFFLSGTHTIDHIAHVMAVNSNVILAGDRMLDFGCGLGRLTRPFSHRYRECVGVDISEEMLKKARELNADFSNLQFVHNTRLDLTIFPDNHFDLIHTQIVLQHLPDRPAIIKFIKEFSRTLRPGGLLILELPDHIPWFRRLWLRRKAYVSLKFFGFSDQYLHEKLHLTNMKMNFLPQKEVEKTLLDANIEIFDRVLVPTKYANSVTYLAKSIEPHS